MRLFVRVMWRAQVNVGPSAGGVRMVNAVDRGGYAMEDGVVVADVNWRGRSG